VFEYPMFSLYLRRIQNAGTKILLYVETTWSWSN